MPDQDHPADTTAPVLSIVVPFFNEEAVARQFHARLVAVMEAIGEPWEAVYVDDGSSDTTLSILWDIGATDPHVHVVALSRNFGKEAALTAGLDHARGEAVVVTDADLQDPPEVIPELVAGWREGYDVVFAQRSFREGETWFKRTTAHAFYRLMGCIGGSVRLPPDTGDFRLMSRRSVEALLRLRERHRFMKGLFAWVGFPSKCVRYHRAPRAAGSSKWNYWKLFNLSIEGITGFTTIPLRLATLLGMAAATLSLVGGGAIILQTLVHGSRVPGYPSLMTVVLFLGGAQLVAIGIIGEYLGRVFNEAKGRPLYIVEARLEPGTRTQPTPLPIRPGRLPA
jgi:glycosyltransferase involved in cell wall biosynthesis